MSEFSVGDIIWSSNPRVELIYLVTAVYPSHFHWVDAICLRNAPYAGMPGFYMPGAVVDHLNPRTFNLCDLPLTPNEIKFVADWCEQRIAEWEFKLTQQQLELNQLRAKLTKLCPQSEEAAKERQITLGEL